MLTRIKNKLHDHDDGGDDEPFTFHSPTPCTPLLSPRPNPSIFTAKSPRNQHNATIYISTTLFLLLFLLLLSFCLHSFPVPSETAVSPLPARYIAGRSNLTEEEREFWEQPDGMGYEPCIEFSIGYRRASAMAVTERRRFLVAEVNGGLNQQRNQIVDAVVVARILGAALVLPVLRVNPIWGDQSGFSDIFDADHFKKTLQSDIHIVSSLPQTHPMKSSTIPFNASPLLIRTKFLKMLNKQGVLMLKGLDSKLSEDLPLDLQKLRCKVAFHALRFARPIRELGTNLARKMWESGPYIAVHLRLEKDVWVRTGCLPGLRPELDRLLLEERRAHPELLRAHLNLTQEQRRAAGLCPLTANEVARALGAPGNARVYVAGGEPLGGDCALAPLKAEFRNVVTKETLASDGELEPYANRSSVLAAVDYIVAASSQVFMPSHGGNMGRAMQGHRAYAGHRKCIRPNKRAVIRLLEDRSLSDEELRREMKWAHRMAMGQPQVRRRKKGCNVIAFPVPECMCRRHRPPSFRSFL